MLPVVLAIASGSLASLLLNRWLVNHLVKATDPAKPSAEGVQAGMAAKFLIDGAVIVSAWILTGDTGVLLGTLFGQAILGNALLLRMVLAPEAGHDPQGRRAARRWPAASRREGFDRAD